ncbi:MAG: hypothetical protein IIV02_06715 [Peptococcaceae bacterium]|nr:hypothetical protein [Peptococcaceae bacterium]
MENLNQYVDKCVDGMLERYAVSDLQGRVFYALGYMDDNPEVKALLWAIAYGERMIGE